MDQWYTGGTMIKFDDPVADEKLSDLKKAQEEEALQFSAQKLGAQYVDLTAMNIQTDALAIIAEPIARSANLAAFKKVGKELHVATLSPEHPETKAELDKLATDYSVIPYVASHKSLEKAWGRYEDVKMTEQATGGLVDISPTALTSISERVETNNDVLDLLRDAQQSSQGQTTRVIEIILGSAIATKSSDIHMEPQDEQVRLRFRQDGVLQDVATLSNDLYRRIVSRIKIVSKLKITNTALAQDGRFTIEYSNAEIEVRVSTVPSAYGESIVMRILDPEGLTVGFDQLGIEPKLLDILQSEIKKPNGMILTTGPTGSGKTTTLYSFLKYIYTPDIKILTIENPIEYHLDGISQTQVDHKKGYDFLAGLRAALRQDPDVIMVGEIRDNETATIAVNASLTGHMVFSTLHTNNAAGTIPRLLDLDVSPDVLSSALTVSLAQRLVRRLCKHCKQETPATPEQRDLIQVITNQANALHKDTSRIADVNMAAPMVYTAPGCAECGGTGYRGRIGLYEAILMTEPVQAILESSPHEREVWDAAKDQGLLNMAEDGIIKVLLGVTDFNELTKVVDLQGYIQITEDTAPVPTSAPLQSYSPTPLATQEFDYTPADNASVRELRKQEMSMLMQYLKTLEQHQQLHPEVSIAEKIYLARRSLMELLETFHPSELFTSPHNNTTATASAEAVLEQLHTLESTQRQNPQNSAAQELGTLSHHLEQAQVSTTP